MSYKKNKRGNKSAKKTIKRKKTMKGKKPRRSLYKRTSRK